MVYVNALSLFLQGARPNWTVPVSTGKHSFPKDPFTAQVVFLSKFARIPGWGPQDEVNVHSNQWKTTFLKEGPVTRPDQEFSYRCFQAHTRTHPHARTHTYTGILEMGSALTVQNPLGLNWHDRHLILMNWPGFPSSLARQQGSGIYGIYFTCPSEEEPAR